MDYLGHAVIESSTPTPPTPVEPDPHFKVIYRQEFMLLIWHVQKFNWHI